MSDKEDTVEQGGEVTPEEEETISSSSEETSEESSDSNEQEDSGESDPVLEERLNEPSTKPEGSPGSNEKGTREEKPTPDRTRSHQNTSGASAGSKREHAPRDTEPERVIPSEGAAPAKPEPRKTDEPRFRGPVPLRGAYKRRQERKAKAKPKGA